MLNESSTTYDLKRARARLAILPLGATEQHSHHLPVATDTILAEAVAREAAARLDAWCMPALPYTISHMHRGLPGTAWLRNSTFMRVIHDLAESLRHGGIREFALVNFHGGNQVLPAVLQDLNLDFPDLISVGVLDPWNGVADAGLFGREDRLQHGNEMETSCMLHLCPSLVRRREIRDQTQKFHVTSLRYAPFPRFARLTHTGKPSTASAEKGRRALEMMGEHTAREIREAVAVARRVRKGRR
jgi:creatinine amidohydrolase